MIDIGYRERDICPPAFKWLKKQPNLYHAWRTCKRGDWLGYWLWGEYNGRSNNPAIRTLYRKAQKAYNAVPYGDDEGQAEVDERRHQQAKAIRRAVTYKQALEIWESQEH